MPNKGCTVRSSDLWTWRVYSFLALSSQKNVITTKSSFFFFFWQLYRILYKVSFALLRGVGHHVLATPMLTCRWCHCSLEGSGFSSLPLGCSCVSDILWFLCVIGAWLVKNDPDPFDYSFCPCRPLLLSQCDAEHLLTHLTASTVISPVKPNPVCFGRRFKV